MHYDVQVGLVAFWLSGQEGLPELLYFILEIGGKEFGHGGQHAVAASRDDPLVGRDLGFPEGYCLLAHFKYNEAIVPVTAYSDYNICLLISYKYHRTGSGFRIIKDFSIWVVFIKTPRLTAIRPTFMAVLFDS